MVATDGPRVLEYNVRFGDPETQSLLPLLKSDLASVMLACTNRSLGHITLDIEPKSAVTIVAAAAGYPQGYPKGAEITVGDVSSGKLRQCEIDWLLAFGLRRVMTDTLIFHAGTAMRDGVLRTSGGRVIAATSCADKLEDAMKKAYDGIRSIKFEGIHFRNDIAAHAVEKLKTKK